MKKIAFILLLSIVLCGCMPGLDFFITFFYQVAMPQESSMQLKLPKDDTFKVQSKVAAKDAITIIIWSDGKVFAYAGNSIHSGNWYTIKGENSITTYLLSMKKQIPESSFIVMIKPSDKASYNDIVNILDEMSTNNIERYTLIDITEKETGFLQHQK